MNRSSDFEAEVGRLLAAAVINRNFRQTLLTNRSKALNGYRNERFHFSKAEQALILSIRAKTLEELADQLNRRIGAMHRQDSRSATE